VSIGNIVADPFPWPSLCRSTIRDQVRKDSIEFALRNNAFVRSNRILLMYESPNIAPHPIWSKQDQLSKSQQWQSRIRRTTDLPMDVVIMQTARRWLWTEALVIFTIIFTSMQIV
jgi:putative ribosome biogenesis GTPase RsgA